MPRYCAVKLCKNRGGVLSKDNKRISFYPFPLRDQARLQKWVDNMKRQEWTPSRHQYLCSEHFTEDSFDLRWGIRYLKHTAIPTIFPYICDDESGRIHNKKNSKIKGRICSSNVQLIRSWSPPRKKNLILKDNDLNNNNNNSSIPSLTAEVSAGDGQVFSVLLMGHLKLETPVCAQEEGKSKLGLNLTQTDDPSAVCMSSSDSPGGLLVDPDAQVKESQTRESLCVCPAVSVLPCQPAVPLTDSTAGADMVADSLRTGPSLSVAITPVVCLKLEDEQEGALLDAPRETKGEGRPNEAEVEGEHACLCEHSYSRQDMDKEQLWSRIAALHAKITELDQREEATLEKVQATEAQVAQLRKQNIVCEEKQKVLEDYFTTVFRSSPL